MSDAGHNGNARAEASSPALSAEGGANGASENGSGLERIAGGAGDDSLQELMASNFIEYASYVIKDRAIPDIDDGLKPVQRRILHSLYELDDGRFHKVANVIGHTMRYHPHGDAAIGSALVVLANKEYFIDKQGNFGNIYTGDEASAARYIECRLSPLAREVLFNPEITEFADSYDGRNREPLALPAKVPSLLMLGSDGIAVGMTTRILPHNFVELLEAQIAILRGDPFRLYPDFLTGGLMDVKDYDDGNGRVKVRAKIEVADDKTLIIREVPPTTTTESVMSSIEDAARRSKIKIAAINDYTSDQPQIQIALPRGVHAEETVQRLYAYTECEVSIGSNLTVIRDQRPVQMRASEVLRYNTEKLLNDLRRELDLELGKLQDRFHEKTLAQIFIENRIYKRIEDCESYETIRTEVRLGLEPFRHLLRRDITDDDIEKLLQLQIRRISLFDINKNRQELDDILKAIDETQYNLKHLKAYATKYIRALLKKYGPLYPRRTRIEDLETIDVKEIALRNVKVGHDRIGHFVGSDVKNSNKDEEPLACTEFDRLVLLRSDGVYKVVPIPERLYVGELKVVLKADKAQVYSMVYRDRKTKCYYAKRFRIDRYIMDREYQACPDGCTIKYFYTNYGVQIRCEFAPRKYMRKTFVDLNFDDIPVRGPGARGVKFADYEIGTVNLLRRGTARPPGDEGYVPEEETRPQDGTTPATAPVPAEPTTVHEGTSTDQAAALPTPPEDAGDVGAPSAVEGADSQAAEAEASVPDAEPAAPGSSPRDGSRRQRPGSRRPAPPARQASAPPAAGPSPAEQPPARGHRPQPPSRKAAPEPSRSAPEDPGRDTRPRRARRTGPQTPDARPDAAASASATLSPELPPGRRTSASGAKSAERAAATPPPPQPPARSRASPQGPPPTPAAPPPEPPPRPAPPRRAAAREEAAVTPPEPAQEPEVPRRPPKAERPTTAPRPPVDGSARGSAAGAKGLRKLIDEETPFFLE